MPSCPDCPKTFSNKVSLQDHHRRCHRSQILVCFHCQYKTKFKFNLVRHMNVHINLNRAPRVHRRRSKMLRDPYLNCCLCDFRSQERREMLDHYTLAHDIQVDEKTLQFADVDAFMTWKKQTEQSECFRFLMKGKHKSPDCVTVWYRCFRDGFFHSKGKNKRRLKMKGSCKINGVCPCSLKAATSKITGAVTVTYISRHVGHAENLGDVNLTNEERRSIVEQLSQRIPFDVVLDSIPDSLTRGECSRIHLTARKDLFNVKKYFQVNDGRLHVDDRTSLEAWVNSVEDYSGLVRFHKPHSLLLPEHPELLDEDFVLILSYDSQIERLTKFGPSCVCFDGTQSAKSYNFELTTLIVNDGESQGFPCAFLISNRSDSKVIELFLTVIKNLLPNRITPQVLMSDVSELYYNGWCATMPKPQNWLFCQWHVDQAWRKNLCKIGDAKKKCTVYKLLRILMDEPDEQMFPVLLEKAMAFLSNDPALSDFFRYFSSQYRNNFRSWAFCFRKHLGINANVILETVHNVIRYIYLEGKRAKRLDKGIDALLRYVRDTLDDQSISKTRGKLTQRIRDRHDRSLNMTSTIIPLENGWLVSSESQAEMYEVKKTGISCNCEDRCDECGICFHEYSCTCVDSMKSNFCKHIHQVVAFINKLKPGSPSTDAGVDPTSDGEFIMITDQEDCAMNEFVNDLSAKHRAVEESSHDIERSKEALSHAFEAILQTVENFEHIDVIRKAIAQIPHDIRALSNGLVFKTEKTPRKSNQKRKPKEEIQQERQYYYQL